MEHLVLVTKGNCVDCKLSWLESATDEVCENYEDLTACVERYLATEAEEDVLA
jgi:hypothetical protein